MTDRISKLKEFLRKDPDDLFSMHALALELVKAGDDGSARVVFENILTKDPEYIGSYYHLGRLLERDEQLDEARRVYANGIAEALKKGENHAANELRSALEELD
jgi:Tfp pilus assembly protein PilF